MDSCPTCRKPVKPRAVNASAPFCSERCRQVDLGKWLNEEHTIPVEGPLDDGAISSGDAKETETS